MRRGLSVSTIDCFADARSLVDLARLAEDAGWAGFFINDYLVYDRARPCRVADTWSVLAAIAASTRAIAFGPMVTSFAKHAPEALAQRVRALEQLAPGRLRLGVGLGVPGDVPAAVGRAMPSYEARVRFLNEGSAVLRHLLSNAGPEGAATAPATAVVSPGLVVPVWVGGYWPGNILDRLTVDFDGVCFEPRSGVLSPAAVRTIRATVAAAVPARHITVVVEAISQPGDGVVASYAAAGADWLLEYVGWRRGDLESARARVHQGAT